MSTLEARIAEVLAQAGAAHKFKRADQLDTDYPHYWCSCGVQTIGPGKFPEHMNTEAALMLAPVIAEAQAVAWNAAVNEADKRWIIGLTSSAQLRNDNPYRSNDE